jgi:tetratricopeptide (TPR) repeat protein
MGKAIMKSALLAAVLILAACASQKKDDVLFFDKASLMGMIYDEDSQPCAGAQLLVDGKSGPITDIRGRFLLPDLARGEHTIAVKKDGYEELSARVVFLNRTDVLYLHVTSFGQLLARAETSLDDRKWDDAAEFLARAEKLKKDDSVLLYLQAILSYRTGKHAEAVSYLTRILDQGIAEPYVYLFLADVYEKGLGEPDKAVTSLEIYLTKRADADVEKRLAALKEKMGK